MRSVLISGAGIAGATLAHWLERFGMEVTLVERAAEVRSSGNPVDVRRAALPVVKQMGVLPALRERATRATSSVVIGEDGRPRARIGGPNRKLAGDDAEVEVPRADLAAVLLEAASGAELVLGDSIAQLDESPGGVDVRFESGTERTFDLVVGADGVHSATRRLLFGPEEQFVRHLGMYAGAVTLPVPTDATAVELFNVPGRLAAIHPGTGTPLALLLFRGPAIAGLDPRGTAQHRAILTERFGGDGWRVPELLERVAATDDLYFDAVSRISLPEWSRGRVALLGDAASSISLLGDGSTKAIVGAHTLATELASGGDHTAAFRRYQAKHERLISSPARVRFAAAILAPGTAAGLRFRNTAFRILGRKP